MNKKLLRKKLALMLATLKKKRKYYTELEYLEGTGTQYINTGYKPNTNTRTVGRVRFNSFVGSNADYVFGVFESPNNYGFNVGSARQYFNVPWGSSTGISLNGLIPQLNTDYDFDISKTGYLIDGQSYGIIGSQSVNSTRNMYLFWSNGTSASGMNGRIYYCQIYDNDILVRDFIPVLDWDMTPCMYDKVTEQLFYNAGTGDFVAGRQIHPVEYLESTGEQYIDTGIIPNINTECSMNLAFVSLDSTYRTPFSVRTADGATNSFTIMSVNSQQTNNSFAFGSNYWSGPSVPSVILNKTVKAVLRKGYASWDGVSGGPGTSITPTTLTAYMFARNANGTASNFFIGRIYDCQLKENDTLVRDYIPAIDQDGTPFLFDRVSHTCYLNQGTGSFKYPAREVEYLKTDGENLIYINPALSYFPDFEVGIKCDANTDRNVTLGTDANNMFERLSATQPYWTLHASGSVFMSSVGVSTYVDAKYKDGVFSSNGNTVGTKANTFPRGTFYLFRAPTNENAYKMSVYFFKAWDNNGVLVRDFIPCFKDGALGMWDKANDVFYPNAGTGAFTTSKIIEPEYE